LLAARRKISAIQTGGHQERGRRAGTENVAAIVGMGAALERAVAQQPELEVRLRALRDRLEAAAREIRVRGSLGELPRTCNTLNVAFEDCEGETLLAALDLEGIAVSTGSACSSGSLEPSPVLLRWAIQRRWPAARSGSRSGAETPRRRSRASAPRFRKWSRALGPEQAADDRGDPQRAPEISSWNGSSAARKSCAPG